MAVEPFEFVAAALERASGLERLEARGTLRIALKQAGLDPRTVSRRQLSPVLEQILPKELAQRGVDDAVALCGSMAKELERAGDRVQESAGTVDEIFGRLAGDPERS